MLGEELVDVSFDYARFACTELPDHQNFVQMFSFFYVSICLKKKLTKLIKAWLTSLFIACFRLCQDFLYPMILFYEIWQNFASAKYDLIAQLYS